MFKRYAKDLPEEVLNWRLGYAVLGMLGLACAHRPSLFS
jgi:hypothetical protein